MKRGTVKSMVAGWTTMGPTSEVEKLTSSLRLLHRPWPKPDKANDRCDQQHSRDQTRD